MDGNKVRPKGRPLNVEIRPILKCEPMKLFTVRQETTQYPPGVPLLLLVR